MTKNALAFKKKPLANETTRLDFGQYKGQSVGEIMKFDASYLVWLAEKEIILFEAWLLDEIYEQADVEDSEYGDDFLSNGYGYTWD